MDSNRNVSLTIACISVVGGSGLVDCIRSILQTGFDCMVIADDDTAHVQLSDVIGEHRVEIISATGRTIPEKRAVAVENAQTDWIAMIEDTCTIGHAWRRGCEQLMACEGASGGSGPVALSPSLDARSRALYCSDYAQFIAPPALRSDDAPGDRMFESDTLPGVNLIYRRDAIAPYITDQGLVESEVNRHMRNDGHSLYMHPGLAVTLTSPDTAGATASARFAHGRLYGGLTAREMSLGHRVVRAAGCAILPCVLSWRALRALVRSRQRLIATLPHIAAFETFWSCGECTGYLLGAGRSIERWK